MLGYDDYESEDKEIKDNSCGSERGHGCLCVYDRLRKAGNEDEEPCGEAQGAVVKVATMSQHTEPISAE